LSRRFQKIHLENDLNGNLDKKQSGDLTWRGAVFGASRKYAVVSAHAKSRFFGAKNAPQNDRPEGSQNDKMTADLS
jgi:hypothetical protein